MKDPAVLFYTQDFITGTILMTDEQRGKYILLLCLQHQNGKLTERDMMKICGRKDEDIWAKFHQENGCFYNKRMLLESEKRTKFCNHQKENINKRWNKKEYHGNTTVLPLENENENEDVIINEKNIIKREVKFKSEVFEFTEKYSDVMLNKFVSYWTEKNKSGTKMRYELEKTFEITRRLATWASRDYDNNKIVKNDDLEFKQLKEKLYGKQPI
jgi:uncharacterized protein YdaU (DUF1376 family)